MSLMQTIEEHKTAVAIAALGAVVLLYLLIHSEGSGQQQANPVSQVLGYNEQQNELNAQYSLQQQQIAAQQDATDQAAYAQEQQYSAAESTANEQTDASLIANLYDTKEGAAVDTAQLGSETSIANTETNDELSAEDSELNASDYQADLQAQLYGQGLTDTTGLETTALNDQSSTANDILQDIDNGAFNKGGEGGENNIAALAASLGESGLGESAEGAAASTATSANNEFSSILSSISNFGKSTVSSLLL